VRAAVARAFSELTSYRIVGQLSNKEIGTVDFLIEYVAPDRKRTSFAGFSTIAIGPTTYVNVGSGWTVAASGAALPPVFDERSLLVQEENLHLTRVGAETVDGEPCIVYTYTGAVQSGRVWVSSRDDVVRKLEGKYGETDLSLTISAVNQPISIEPPI
jgi:hypothetical protein